MNLFKYHTNPETLHGFDEINDRYLEKLLLALAEEDDLPLLSELLIDTKNKDHAKFLFNTRKGKCPFYDKSGSNDYYDMFIEQHLNLLNKHWLEFDSDYHTHWIIMKPELIKWLKSGYKRQNDLIK